MSFFERKVQRKDSRHEIKVGSPKVKKGAMIPKSTDCLMLIRKPTLSIIDSENVEETVSIPDENQLIRFNTICSKLKDNLTTCPASEDSPHRKKSSLRLSYNEIDNHKNIEEIKEQTSESEAPLNNEPTEDTEQEQEKEEEAFKEKFRKLFSKSKVYDSFSEEEEDVEVENTIYIEPDSLTKFYFDLLVLLCTLALSFLTPIELAFSQHFEGKETFFFMINLVSDILFILDFVLSFFVAYNNKSEELVTNYLSIAIHYLQNWFFLDLICAVPYNTIINIKNKTRMSDEYRLSEFLKFVNLLKLIKMSSGNSALNSILFKVLSTKMGSHLLIILTIFLYFLLVHILSSIYIIIGLNNTPNWILQNNLDIKNQNEIYCSSIYFIFVSVFGVGYGDIVSSSLPEKLFNLFVLIFGVLMQSWLVSTLSEYGHEKLFERLNKEKGEELAKKLSLLEEIRYNFHGWKNAELFGRIERFLYYNYYKESFNSNEIFELLPHSLKCELIEAMYKPVINNFIFFKYFKNRDFVIEVILHFIPALYSKNERLLAEGDIVEEMFFVKKGKLALEMPVPTSINEQFERLKEFQQKRKKTDLSYEFTRMRSTKATKDSSKHSPKPPLQKKEYIRLIEIRKNEHYGDVSMFLNGKSPLSVRVTSKTAELYLLKKTDAVQISSSFPSIWRALITRSLHNVKQINSLIKKTIRFFYKNNEQLIKFWEQYTSVKLSIDIDDNKTKPTENENYITKSLAMEGSQSVDTERDKDSLLHLLENSDKSLLVKDTFEKVISEKDVGQHLKTKIINIDESPSQSKQFSSPASEPKDRLVVPKASLFEQKKFGSMVSAQKNPIPIKDTKIGLKVPSPSVSRIYENSDPLKITFGRGSMNCDDSKVSTTSEYRKEDINNELNDGEELATLIFSKSFGLKKNAEKRVRKFSSWNLSSSQTNFEMKGATKSEQNTEVNNDSSPGKNSSQNLSSQAKPQIKKRESMNFGQILKGVRSRFNSISSNEGMRRNSTTKIINVKSEEKFDVHPKVRRRETFAFVNEFKPMKNFAEKSGKIKRTNTSNNVLSAITSNIEDNSLNLKDPKKFYARKFSRIVMAKKSQNLLTQKLDDMYSLLKNVNKE